MDGKTGQIRHIAPDQIDHNTCRYLPTIFEIEFHTISCLNMVNNSGYCTKALLIVYPNPRFFC